MKELLTIIVDILVNQHTSTESGECHDYTTCDLCGYEGFHATECRIGQMETLLENLLDDA